MTTRNYSLANDFPDQVLSQQALIAQILVALPNHTIAVEEDGDDVTVVIEPDLTVPQTTTLDGVITAHNAAARTASLAVAEQARALAILRADPLSGLPVTCVAAGLVITTNVGNMIVDDVTTVVADSTDTKFVLISCVYDEGGDVVAVVAREKTTGSYADLAADEVVLRTLKEFSVVANGTDLVEV